jgi:fumarate hydratase class I
MNEIRLNTPIAEADARALKAGDRVLLSGLIVTARDRAHRWLVEEAKCEDVPFPLLGGVIYHCGPIARRREDGGWDLVAAGPTTSERMNAWVPRLLAKFGVRAIVGKGGMSPGVLDALKTSGAVYLSAVGGAAQVLAGKVTRVAGALKVEEFGIPEALWALEVRDFPAVVTMDSRGRSLHEETAEASRRRLLGLLETT